MEHALSNALTFFARPEAAYYYAAPAKTLLLYNATQAELEQYLSNLQTSGYALHDRHSIGSNDHATLLGTDHVLHTYHNPSESAIRIVYDSSTALPEAKPSGNGTAQATLYQFETDHTLIDCGMCYIIQNKDGSFFIIDSAHYYSFNDNDRIHKFLRERTAEGERIVIAGWYFSHGHVDHVGKFMDFLRYNCNDVIIEALYFNFVPDDYFQNSTMSNDENKRVLMNFYQRVNASGLNIITLHTGQRFYIRELCFEVLYTHEDVYPKPFNDYNTSSSVLRLTVGDTIVIFPGDASGIAADILVDRYGKLLKCDILQAAHHGHFGLSSEFYQHAHADIMMFPTTQIKYDEEYLVYEANRTAAALCKECHIASNGTIAIALPYSGEGVSFLGDETFEDFDKIRGLWGYEYTEERKRQLYEEFLARGGSSVTLFQRS